MISRQASNGTFWTNEEVQFLTENYRNSASVELIAKSLNRSVASVRVKSQRLGLNKHGGRKPWMLGELEFLENQWGILNYQEIANRIGRSPEAVRVKAISLGYSNYQLSQDGITLNELARALGVDYKKIRRWTDAPYKIRLRSFCIRISNKQTKKLINLNVFWKWAEKNKELIDFSRLEKNSLGAEPAWVLNQRKLDYHNRQKRIRHSYWTKAEEIQLKHLVNEFKYTYSEITVIMNRSEKVIAQKLIDLDIKARPLKADPRPWTLNETAALIEMVDQGIDKSQIAQRLGRSETAIMGKQRKLKRQQNIQESIR